MFVRINPLGENECHLPLRKQCPLNQHNLGHYTSCTILLIRGISTQSRHLIQVEIEKVHAKLTPLVVVLPYPIPLVLKTLCPGEVHLDHIAYLGT